MKVALSCDDGKVDVVDVESVDEAEQKYGKRVLGHVVYKSRAVGMSCVMLGDLQDELQKRWGVSEVERLLHIQRGSFGESTPRYSR